MVRFSVIIPAFKDLGYAADTIKTLAGSDVEFIVVADLLSEQEKRELEKLAEKYPVKLDLSDERRGKVNSLNRAISLAEGDIFVFIDSDARVVRRDLLELIEDALREGDFGSGIILLRGRSFLENMARIDYIAINTCLYMGARHKFSVGLNGAFIFAKREVVDALNGFAPEIIEDVDFAIRASLKGFKPVFIQEPCVETGAPNTWKGWYKQRRRWVYGGGALVVKYWRTLLPYLRPVIPQLLCENPVLIVLLPLFLLPDELIYKFVLFLTTLLAAVFPPSIPILYVSIVYGFARQLLFVLVGLVAVWLWFSYWARRFKFKRFRHYHILPYYFLYGPIWAALTVVWAAYAIAKRGKVSLPDWKT